MVFFKARGWFHHHGGCCRKTESRVAFRWLVQCVLTLITIGVLRAHGSESPEFSVVLPSRQYSFGDSLIIAVKVQIPEGFVLVGNPKGPGVGRPLKIRIRSADSGIKWIEVRKTEAEKYGSSFGDWVWAYHDEAVFFCVGVVIQQPDTLPDQFEGMVEIEGLLCRNECRLIGLKAPFSFAITGRKTETVHFSQQVPFQELFVKTKTMMVLEQTGR